MSKMKSTAEQKKLKVFSQFCQNFWTLENTLGTGLARQKLNFLESVCPITPGVKVTQYFRKGT